ncbi:MAG: isochorismatase family protein [Bacteroidales bacterium]|nr:isochorismatase family protein [Bacteroidales bacterium]
MNTLVIVDLQRDFYHPEGALYVPGAEILPERTAQLIPHYDQVIFTLDWHPQRHISFKPNGGIWPVHCVQYSAGAALPDEVLRAVADLPYMVYRKGQSANREEYGAFEDITPAMEIVLRHSDDITVAGLCGDYCVGETIKNLVRMGLGDRISVSLACTGSIDDGSTLREIIQTNHIRTK